MAINAVMLAILAGVGFAMWMFVPAFAEAVSALAWSSWESVIRANPIQKLRSQLVLFDKAIMRLEQRIEEATAEYNNLTQLFKNTKPSLDVDEQKEWEANLRTYAASLQAMVGERDQCVTDRDQFQKDLTKAESKYKLANAFLGAGRFFSMGSNTRDNEGVRIALNQVDTQLAQSQARIATILSRPVTKPQALANQTYSELSTVPMKVQNKSEQLV